MLERVTVGPSSFKKLLPLLIAGTLGRLPTVTLPIASLLLVADRTSLTRGGFASGAVSLGAGLIGVLVGRHLDSERADHVLTALTILHFPATFAFIALAGTNNTVALLVVSLLAGASVAPIGPVVRAFLAEKSSPEDRQRIFAWDSISVELTWIGGPLLVSLAILTSGPAAAVAMSPILALVGVLAIRRQPARKVHHSTESTRWLNSDIVRIIVAFALAGAAFRALTIAVTEVARLTGHNELTGALVAFWASGSVLGAWFVSRRGTPPIPVIGVVLAITVGLIGLGESSLWLTGALAFISGIPTAPFVAGLNTLVTTVTHESAHARAFASLQAASTITAAVGAAVGGAAIDRYGPSVVSIPCTILLLGSARLSVVHATKRRVATAPIVE